MYELQALQVELQPQQRLRIETPVALKLEKQQRVETRVIREPGRNSAEAASQERRESLSVSDIVSGEEIKKAADSSASQAAARMVGATVVGDRFVYVRGLGERYSNALFNGCPLPSPEPDQQAVPFDVFPASLLARLRIAKSATADIPGDFAGGSVQPNTQEFPSRQTLRVGLGLGANTQTVLQPMLTYNGGKTDWLGVDDGTRALPRRKAGQTDVEYFRTFPNQWSRREQQGTPNYSLSFSIGDVKHWGARRLGYLAAFHYSAEAQTRFEEIRTFYLDADRERHPVLRPNVEYANGQFADGTPQKTWRSTTSVQRGALASLNWHWAPLHRISWTGLFTQNSDDETRHCEGYNTGTDREVRYTRLRFVARSLLFLQLKGSSQFPNRLGVGMLDWNAAYALAFRSEPDMRKVAYQRGVSGDVFRLANSGTSGQRFYAQNNEHQVFFVGSVRPGFFGLAQLDGAFCCRCVGPRSLPHVCGKPGPFWLHRRCAFGCQPAARRLVGRGGSGSTDRGTRPDQSV